MPHDSMKHATQFRTRLEILEMIGQPHTSGMQPSTNCGQNQSDQTFLPLEMELGKIYGNIWSVNNAEISYRNPKHNLF